VLRWIGLRIDYLEKLERGMSSLGTGRSTHEDLDMARKKTTEKPEKPAAKPKLRMVRLELDEVLHKLLRLEAAREDMSLAELARTYVEAALESTER